jgi:hypothetical protein
MLVWMPTEPVLTGGVMAPAPAAASPLEEPPVEFPSEAPRPMIRPDAHEVYIALVGGTADETHEEGDELDGEARPGEVPENGARQPLRYPASTPPIVHDRDHACVVGLPELL